jgi:hypothetical protein
MTLPGDRLLAFARWFLDEDAVSSSVEPTLADLQFEFQRADGHVGRQQLVLLRGYVAIVRLLLWHGLIWRSPMRRLLTVLVLGLLGSALLGEILSLAPGGPAGLSAFFIMAVLTPIVLRILHPGGSYRHSFVSCLSVGLMMSAVLLGWVFANAALRTPPPWYAYVLSSLFTAGCVAAASALAASVASRPMPESTVRRRMVRVAVSAIVFAACYAINYLWAAILPLPTARILGLFGWVSFLAFLFAAVSIVVYLPVLLGVQRVVSVPLRRTVLTMLGALLFPVPLLVLPFLQGRLDSTLRFLAGDPGALMFVCLPYVLAGAVLGWLLAQGRVRAAQPAVIASS